MPFIVRGSVDCRSYEPMSSGKGLSNVDSIIVFYATCHIFNREPWHCSRLISTTAVVTWWRRRRLNLEAAEATQRDYQCNFSRAFISTPRPRVSASIDPYRLQSAVYTAIYIEVSKLTHMSSCSISLDLRWLLCKCSIESLHTLVNQFQLHVCSCNMMWAREFGQVTDFELIRRTCI